jgi:2-polyprenyl-6-methoxyphenol hydroxylase-like FAD-dependent oxidoreductase
MADHDVQVLVVGGGPVGLSMALFLARHDISVLLVERRGTTSPMPRATHVTRRSMELFREAGIEADIADAGFAVVLEGDPRAEAAPERTLPRVVFEVSSIATLHRRADVLETGEEELAVPGPCPPYWCGQDKMEPILRAAAVREGADVRFNHELTDLQIVPEGAVAKVEDRQSGETRSYRARYVVAADGAKGRTAQRMGIPFGGLGAIARRMSILFSADLEKHIRGRRFFMSMIENEGFSGALMQLNGQHRWCAAIDVGERDKEEFTPSRCLELVRAAIGDPAVDVELSGVFTWEARHRVARSYRSGPVFLVGDAAHLHPPSGGFGSNVGFQDSHNLAWKIAAVERGWAGEALLDTYDTERRPVGTATAEQTLLIDGVPPERLGGSTLCDQRTLIMGYSYNSAAVVGEPPEGPFPERFDLSGAPGTRVPHVVFAQTSTSDLVGGGRFTLFSPEPDWMSVAAAVEVPVPLHANHIPPAAARAFAESCGTGRHGAVLVRPDGFVGWRRHADSPIPTPVKQEELTASLRQIAAI